MIVSMPASDEAVGGMDAAIVELDPLADPVGAAAEDDDLVALARIGLAFGRREPVALVAGVHVRGQRGELGGAGVDALVDRVQPEPLPQRGDLGLARSRRAWRGGRRKTPSASAATSPSGRRAARPGAPAPRPRRSRGCVRGTRGRNGRRHGSRRSRGRAGRPARSAAAGRATAWRAPP